MPALAFVPGVARVSVQAKMAGVNIANVFHIGYGTDFASQADMDDLATFIRGRWVALVLPFTSSALTLGQVTALDLSTDVGPFGVAAGSTAGSAAGTPYPQNIAMCVSWKINRRYRGGHPRTYVCGILQPNQSDSTTWASGILGTVGVAFDGFRTAVNAHVLPNTFTAKLQCVHYIKNKVPLVDPIVDDIVGMSIDNRIDSQRRRLGRDR